MTIETSMNEKECVIAVEGRIDTLTAPELEQSVMDNAQNSDKIKVHYYDIDKHPEIVTEGNEQKGRICSA